MRSVNLPTAKPVTLNIRVRLAKNIMVADHCRLLGKVLRSVLDLPAVYSSRHDTLTLCFPVLSIISKSSNSNFLHLR